MLRISCELYFNKVLEKMFSKCLSCCVLYWNLMQNYTAVRINIKYTIFQYQVHNFPTLISNLLLMYFQDDVYGDICRKFCSFFTTQLKCDADIRLQYVWHFTNEFWECVVWVCVCVFVDMRQRRVKCVIKQRALDAHGKKNMQLEILKSSRTKFKVIEKGSD